MTYESFSDKDKLLFSDAINALLSQSVLLKFELDFRTNRRMVQPLYQFALQQQTLIRDHLGRMGWTLAHNDIHEYFQVSHEEGRYRKFLKKPAILTLLALGYLYYDRINDRHQGMVFTDYEELVKCMQQLDLQDGKRNLATTIDEGISELKKYQLVDHENHQKRASTRIVIYPAIHLFLTRESIKERIAQFQSLSLEDQEESE